MKDGHVSAITLAVNDVGEDDSTGNDHHGSKIIVISFDGAALDRDRQADSGRKCCVNAAASTCSIYFGNKVPPT